LKDVNELISNNYGLVGNVIKRYFGYVLNTPEFDDYYQSGCIGLVKAERKFDHNYGTKFSTYATTTIIGEIKRYIRDYSNNLIYVPRTDKELYSSYRALIKHGYTFDEICEKLKVDQDHLTEVVNVLSGYISFNTTTYSGKDGSEIELGDILSDKDIETDFTSKSEISEKLKALNKILTVQERKILKLRSQGKTQKQIGDLVGSTQVYVGRKLKRIKELYNEISYLYENNKKLSINRKWHRKRVAI